MKILTLLIVLITLTLANVYSQEDRTAKRFIIGIEADYHNWNSSLNEYKIDGEEVPTEDIDFYNDNYDFIFSYYSYNLMVGYDILENLQVFGMAGLATIRQETNDLSSDEESPHNLFLTNDPGVKFSVEVLYTYELTEKISMVFEPEFSYLMFDDMKLVENAEPNVHTDNKINLGLMEWRAGLYAKYDLGWIKPFLGVVYQDFIKNVEFGGQTVDSFNNSVYSERELTFNQDMIFAASAGFRVVIDPYKFLTVRANVGEGYSIFGSVMFKL